MLSQLLRSITLIHCFLRVRVRSTDAMQQRTGKTRTKDKYRVVYTDKQRMELEREFQSNRYITMRRKAELSITLGLSERQIKIWFQNRRAKERKMNRKKLQHSQQASTTTPASPGLAEPVEAHPGMSPNGFFSDTLSKEY
uniref:Caudal type homeobox 1a n=1 Tax=Takifugu rubripes TaxID=31033 RepID=H2T509_TAKRU